MVFAPEVIRTRAICSPALATPPTNENPWLPATRAFRVKIRLLAGSKKSILVRLATSTSTKIRPKAEVVAGVVVPGRKKDTSVTLLLTAVNSLWALNAWKSFAKPNRAGVASPALALTRKPVPGVLKTTPRGELELKKLADRGLGSACESGTPSQLISRRRPPKEPLAPATVPPPTAPRKASRVGVIEAAFEPAASKTVKPARTGVATAARASRTVATDRPANLERSSSRGMGVLPKKADRRSASAMP